MALKATPLSENVLKAYPQRIPKRNPLAVTKKGTVITPSTEAPETKIKSRKTSDDKNDEKNILKKDFFDLKIK